MVLELHTLVLWTYERLFSSLVTFAEWNSVRRQICTDIGEHTGFVHVHIEKQQRYFYCCVSILVVINPTNVPFVSSIILFLVI